MNADLSRLIDGVADRLRSLARLLDVHVATGDIVGTARDALGGLPLRLHIMAPDVRIDRNAVGRYGLNIADVQSVVSAAIGGDNIGETIVRNGRMRTYKFSHPRRATR
jgi:hypothetical protein